MVNFNKIIENFSHYLSDDIFVYQILTLFLLIFCIDLLILNIKKKKAISRYKFDLHERKESLCDFSQRYNKLLCECKILFEENNKIKQEREKSIKQAQIFKQKKVEQEEYEKSHQYKINLIENNSIQCRKNLLSKPEKEIFDFLVNNKKITQNFVIFTQIPLNAILNSPDKVYVAYNYLRVDFLFCLKNDYLTPVLVFEYNGSGHYKQDNEQSIKERDERKKQAIQKTKKIKFLCLENLTDDKNKTKEFLHNNLINALNTICLQCGSPLVLRNGPKGKFLGCSSYPDCKFTKILGE